MSKAIETLKGAKKFLHTNYRDSPVFAAGFALMAIEAALKELESAGEVPSYTINIPADMTAAKIAEAVKQGVGSRPTSGPTIGPF